MHNTLLFFNKQINYTVRIRSLRDSTLYCPAMICFLHVSLRYKPAFLIASVLRRCIRLHSLNDLWHQTGQFIKRDRIIFYAVRNCCRILCHNMNTAMHLCRRILAVFAIVLPPVKFYNFH